LLAGAGLRADLHWGDKRKAVAPDRSGDVPLPVGHTMTYVFDFGDQWEFDVSLEQVDPEMVIKDSVILEAYGEPPEQYPGWGDWE
jgi:hypothetical protein